MRQWIDESSTRLLGLIGFLTVLNTLLLIGLYMRMAPATVSSEEPEEVQTTGSAPVASHEEPQGVPIQTGNVARAFEQLLEPFESDLTGASFDVTLPTEAQIRAAEESQDFQSKESQEAFQLIQAAYAQRNLTLPPIQ